MRAIFISYRRDDAEGQAGRLFDDLTEQFGPEAVFMDVAAIEAGRDFRRAIDEQVASCGVLLAIIGKSWLTASDEKSVRRLDDAADFVRLEIASALKRDIPVVPVLVQGARMPRASDLSEDLRELAYRNGVELTHARWDSDLQVLVKALRSYVQATQKRNGAGQPLPPGARRAARTRSVLTLTAAAVTVIVFATGAYLWQRSEAAREAALGEHGQRLKGAKDEIDRLHTEKLAADEAAVNRARRPADAEAQRSQIAAVQEAKEQVNAVERAKAGGNAEARSASDARVAERTRQQELPADVQAKPNIQAKHEERASPLRRARWTARNFPPPNGGRLLFTITSSGDPACASYDGAGCLWGVTYAEIDFTKLRPLVCGDAHKAKWGSTGYDDPKHWCSLARKGALR
jgi:hypothetical protein